MTKRIMLVMPDLPTRESYCDFLHEMGYHVYVLDDPRRAELISRNYIPDMILCYDDFCETTGFDFAENIRKNNLLPDTRFLLMSSRPQMEDERERQWALEKVDDLIQLPIEQAELYGYITNWLESDNPEPVSSLKAYNFQMVDPDPKALKAWDKGEVSLISIGKLFNMLIRTNQSGTLLIKGERRKMKVLIDSGNVVDVHSNYLREDSLGQYLVKANVLTKEQNEKSLDLAKKQDIPQGEALIQLCILEKDDLINCLTEHKILKLLNIFQRRWYKAKFVFREGPVGDNNRSFMATPLAKIIGTGIMNIARKKDLYDIFFRKNKERIKLNMNENFSRLARILDLGPALMDQARQLNGSSLEEIKAVRSDQFENNLRLAFLLIVTKGMKFAA